MSNLKIPQRPPINGRRESTLRSDIVGAVNYAIGTGKHAQDSVVWLTIKWSFSLGLLISFVMILYTWPVRPEGSHPPVRFEFPMDNLESIWSIFVPIVTLALGYMFGKGK